MTSAALLEEILRLQPTERMRLLEQIWDSLSPDETAEMPDWHRRELDLRLDDPAEGATKSWAEVREQLRGKKR
jgi:putative addiction module component (TIGR02574 family)